jgi:glycosyltransferase involved in cell wall biosynthesis
LRVVLDARLVTYQPAGIGNYVMSLLGAMRGQAQAELTVLISRKDPKLAARLRPLAARRVWTPPHHRFEQLALAVELLPLRADVYHAPDFIPPFLRRFPTVVTVHDLAFLRMPELLTPESRRYYGQIHRAVRHADRIIAVSDRTRRDLVELVGAPAGRIDVVYEAADSRYGPVGDGLVAAARRRFGLDRDYLLFVGTREPRKNLGRLLAAYAWLVARRHDAPELVIAGRKGWLADDLEARAEELGLAGRVRWLGGVDPEALPGLYAGALAFVFPSLYEGFGLPVLEAMACGTPVVASTGGALPEIAADAALLVDPLDVEALGSTMARVVAEPALRIELRERGRARACCFSWQLAAEQTLDVYQRAA